MNKYVLQSRTKGTLHMHSLMAQFGHPRGFWGHVVGMVMAYENRERNQWAASLLQVQPGDHILEIGFGPGLAIQHLAQTTSAGLIAGVDESPVMVQQARRRNAISIQRGRVAIHQGSVTQLPFSDATFEIVFAVNSLHHWPDPKANVREIWRVLKHSGEVAIIEQPRGPATDDALQAREQELTSLLTTAEFSNVRLKRKPMRPAPSLCVLASK
jgi:ubiquinone/menaquinone biosynthesis C-methylase UbiE